MKTWRWRTSFNIPYKTDLRGYEFENDYFAIYPDGQAVVKEGYATDGVTPQIPILDWGYVGLPEGRIIKEVMLPSTYREVFLHDSLSQFKDEIGISRAQGHSEFCRESKRSDFTLGWLYRLGVNLYGMVRR